MDSVTNTAMQHVRHLAGEIGSRVIGSPGNHAAAAYIAGIFHESGLSVSYQEFSCPYWIEESTSLELDGEALEAAANTFSPSCDVTSETVAVGTWAELEAAEIADRVVIFYGELAQRELAAKRAIYVPERDRHIIQLLEERRPAGLITVNPTPHGLWRLTEDFDLAIPSVTVTARAGLKLLSQPGKTVHMRLITRRSPGSSANIIARLDGPLPGKIVLCAHYDTKVDTPGAYDNAAGVACILTLAQLLPKIKHRYSLEWVAFSGEEMYGLGDMTYASQAGNGFQGIFTAINFDGVGPRVAANTIAIFSASQAFEDLVHHAKAGYPGVAQVDPWPASDHYIFYSHGVPSIAFSSQGVRDIFHTPEDTVDWISPEKLEEAISLARDILCALDDMPFEWSRASPTN